MGFLGADWWGSDARAMAAELRRQGQLLVERHYEDYLSTKWQSPGLKALRRLSFRLIRQQYNKAVLDLLAVDALDCLLVFKGMLLRADVLEKFKQKGVPCYLVYPDVSFRDHDPEIWKCLPLYDCVFTTKSYHLHDLSVTRRTKEIRCINHGFDPEVHRPVPRSEALFASYGCDVSFVGCWSAKKERLLRAIAEALPGIDLVIWGPNWHRASAALRTKWRGRGAYGDELAAIYSCSRINLGLLSESGTGTQIGDQTTARSWQIPAARGLLLHEDTTEIRRYFLPGAEIEVFRAADELVSKVQLLLCNEQLCERVRDQGYKRCISAPYTYAPAVKSILEFHGREARTASDQ